MGIPIPVSFAGHRRHLAVANDRNAPEKHVCRWQEHFAQEGFDGLLRDKMRRSRINPRVDEPAGSSP